MDERHHIEIVTSGASRIISSLQSAIFSAMQASAEGVQAQVKMAASFQRLEMQESICEWLIQRRIDQETKLAESDLRPAVRAMLEHKIKQIDGELEALLRSSGIEDNVAAKAVNNISARPRISKGEPGAGRFLPTNGNGHS